MWQKLMVFASEQARHGRHPLHVALIRRLREEQASGATALRGFWGYHGDHAPHGDRLLSLRRHVPVVTVVVDTPERSRRWFEIVSELTASSGLVTSEKVPAFRATGPGIADGSLDLL
jgi:PII-like signaling protein